MSKEQSGPRGFQVADLPEETGSQTPPITFGAFALSLATSGLVHLGQVASPDAPEGSSPGPPNLPLARQTIELLEMLQQKTRGNLDQDEEKLLESLLYDLRMGYVRAREKAGSSG
jgi:hypothetical protein